MAKIQAHLYSTIIRSRPRKAPFRRRALNFLGDIVNKAEGNFGRATRHYRWIPNPILFPILLWTRRDAILLTEDEEPIGLCAFQSHFAGSQFHSFAYDVIESRRKRGHCRTLIECFLDLSHQRRASVVRFHGNIDDEKPVDPKVNYDPRAIAIQVDKLRPRQAELGLALIGGKDGHAFLEPQWEQRLVDIWSPTERRLFVKQEPAHSS